MRFDRHPVRVVSGGGGETSTLRAATIACCRRSSVAVTRNLSNPTRVFSSNRFSYVPTNVHRAVMVAAITEVHVYYPDYIRAHIPSPILTNSFRQRGKYRDLDSAIYITYSKIFANNPVSGPAVPVPFSSTRSDCQLRRN